VSIGGTRPASVTSTIARSMVALVVLVNEGQCVLVPREATLDEHLVDQLAESRERCEHSGEQDKYAQAQADEDRPGPYCKFTSPRRPLRRYARADRVVRRRSRERSIDPVSQRPRPSVRASTKVRFCGRSEIDPPHCAIGWWPLGNDQKDASP